MKKEMENGQNWPFFEGPNGHFAVSEADGPKPQPASLQNFTSVESGCVELPPAPGIGQERHFSTDVGTNRLVRAMTTGRTVGFAQPKFAHSAPH